MTDVIMPKMGDGMEEGTLLAWLKQDGEKVKSGEIIGTIQTDKATLELESPASGVLSGFLIQGGQTVPVGQPIAAILKDGEKLPADWSTKGSAPAASAPAPPQDAPVAAPTPAATASPAPVAQPPSAPSPASQPSARVKASPLAKKVADELGLDLGSLKGTGPGGRIVEHDVRTAPTLQAAPAPLGPAPESGLTEDRLVPFNRLRQITADRTSQSKAQVPHFYVTVEVDVDRVMALREMFEEEESGKVSVNDFVVKACANALREMPEVNATFEAQGVRQHAAVHIGIAAAIEEGLTLPVVKDVHRMTLRQIALRTRDLVWKARENKLTLDELSGSTFAISNMGMLNVDSFSAIIVQPNAAILAISTAHKKAVVNEDDELEIRWRMNITGSFDHRVVDGAIGARFMNLVRGYLENPTRLVG